LKIIFSFLTPAAAFWLPFFAVEKGSRSEARIKNLI
jgi:hypothetical protein